MTENNTNSIVETILNKAKSNLQRLLFPENDDERIVKACEVILREKIAIPILIGNQEQTLAFAKKINADLTGVQILDPFTPEFHDKYVSLLYDLRKSKGMTPEIANETLKDNMYFATMHLYSGNADGIVYGAAHATADTLRPALQIIKTKDGVKVASSYFIMAFPTKTVFFSDCGFVINPSSEQLCEIALSTAESAKSYGIVPKVALLSFSTKGSGKDPLADKVIAAYELLKTKNPDFLFDGELQLDSATVPAVAAKKCPNSPLKGEANVLIFPDLNSGNIGYKIAERYGGAMALGPIVQGLRKPVNDLSRGCSVDDVVKVAAITAVQAQQSKTYQ
jgi:phosphate acetyltransferase